MHDSKAPTWPERHPRLAAGLVFLICLAFVEGVARIAVGLRIMPYRLYPTNREPQYWAYVDPVVGIWRYANHEWHHEEPCVDVVYRTNSMGARDRERALHSDAERRFVILGDSMVEGYALAVESRLTNVMETRTGLEFMNFATAGGFGTIQEWLLYADRLAAYDHSDVIIFIYPGNDFRDNEPSEFGADVYRPFLRPSGDGYEVYYPVAFEDRLTDIRPPGTVIKNTIDNNVYALNGLRQAIHALKDLSHGNVPARGPARYREFTDLDLDRLLYALDRLVSAAGERRVHLVTIPAEQDFDAAQNDGYAFRLVDELTAFAAARDRVEYLDLLPAMLEDARENDRTYADYELPCDGHWGRLGHAFAADVVLKHLGLAP